MLGLAVAVLVNVVDLRGSSGFDFRYTYLVVLFAAFVALWSVWLVAQWGSQEARYAYLWKNGLEAS